MSTPISAPLRPLGEILVEKGLISSQQLEEALRLRGEWGSRLGDVILSTGWVRPLEFYCALADHFGLAFVDLMNDPVDDALVDQDKLLEYTQHLYIPWKRVNGALLVATAEPGSEAMAAIAAADPAVRFVVTSKFDIIWELQRVGERRFSHLALYRLAEKAPAHSARVVVTRRMRKLTVSSIDLPAVVLSGA